jgi:hypothetical protein
VLARGPGCFAQRCRCLTRLQERRGTVDRCEAEEDAAERGAGLVVQLARDPAALGLLGVENRSNVSRATRLER